MFIDVKLLIEQVQLRPVIWHKKFKTYRNRVNVEKAWIEIGRTMKLPRAVLRKKWKYLRDQFRSECKKIPAEKFFDPSLTESDYERYTSWIYFKFMLFLKSQIRCRKLKRPITDKFDQSDEQENEDDDDDDDDHFEIENHEKDEGDSKEISIINAAEVEEQPQQTQQDFESMFVIQNIAPTKAEDYEAQIAQSQIKTQPRNASSIGQHSQESGKRELKEKRERLERLEKKLEMLKQLNGIKNSEREIDEDKAFFQSLLPHLKALTPQQKLRCCIDIQANVYKHVYKVGDDEKMME